jgi:hypothetical protein
MGSYLTKIKKTIREASLNFSGWQTKRRIVVFESDDWGSIRMPSITAYKAMMDSGFNLESSPYCKYDSLETDDDFSALFEVLGKYRDARGNHPVFTLNTVVGNPDFVKIKESNYEQYHYQKFIDTYKDYTKCQNSWVCFKQGMLQRLIRPQLHGREHVNVFHWLKMLRNENPVFTKAFQLGFWGMSRDVLPEFKYSVQATFDCTGADHLQFLEDAIVDGQKIFREIFGFNSSTFIPNNFIFPTDLFNTLISNDIQVVQGMKYQLLPLNRENKRNRIRRYQGSINRYGLLDLVRNCSYEPSAYQQSLSTAVNQCVAGIKNAFFLNKPAIISTHRINYSGSLCEINRINSLKGLDLILKELIAKFPEVEFMSSDILGKLILDEKLSILTKARLSL